MIQFKHKGYLIELNDDVRVSEPEPGYYSIEGRSLVARCAQNWFGKTPEQALDMLLEHHLYAQSRDNTLEHRGVTVTKIETRTERNTKYREERRKEMDAETDKIMGRNRKTYTKAQKKRVIDAGLSPTDEMMEAAEQVFGKEPKGKTLGDYLVERAKGPDIHQQVMDSLDKIKPKFNTGDKIQHNYNKNTYELRACGWDIDTFWYTKRLIKEGGVISAQDGRDKNWRYDERGLIADYTLVTDKPEPKFKVGDQVEGCSGDPYEVVARAIWYKSDAEWRYKLCDVAGQDVDHPISENQLELVELEKSTPKFKKGDILKGVASDDATRELRGITNRFTVLEEPEWHEKTTFMGHKKGYLCKVRRDDGSKTCRWEHTFELLSAKPEPKFKPGDIVKYSGGDEFLCSDTKFKITERTQVMNELSAGAEYLYRVEAPGWKFNAHAHSLTLVDDKPNLSSIPEKSEFEEGDIVMLSSDAWKIRTIKDSGAFTLDAVGCPGRHIYAVEQEIDAKLTTNDGYEIKSGEVHMGVFTCLDAITTSPKNLRYATIYAAEDHVNVGGMYLLSSKHPGDHDRNANDLGRRFTKDWKDRVILRVGVEEEE